MVIFEWYFCTIKLQAWRCKISAGERLFGAPNKKNWVGVITKREARKNYGCFTHTHIYHHEGASHTVHPSWRLVANMLVAIPPKQDICSGPWRLWPCFSWKWFLSWKEITFSNLLRSFQHKAFHRFQRSEIRMPSNRFHASLRNVSCGIHFPEMKNPPNRN